MKSLLIQTILAPYNPPFITDPTTSMTQLSSSPLPSPSPCNPHLHDCRWWPYSTSSSFGLNTALILLILLSALTCALALNTAIRCFLRGPGLPRFRQDLDQKTNCEASAPTIVYSADMKLGGAEADCAICLSEFVEGDKIRVLERCKHGFHNQCIKKWLCRHSSCPVCRSTCLASSSGSDISPQQVPAP